MVKAAAGVGKSVFISSKGEGYWCGEWTGTLEHVSTLFELHSPKSFYALTHLLWEDYFAKLFQGVLNKINGHFYPFLRKKSWTVYIGEFQNVS